MQHVNSWRVLDQSPAGSGRRPYQRPGGACISPTHPLPPAPACKRHRQDRTFHATPGRSVPPQGTPVRHTSRSCTSLAMMMTPPLRLNSVHLPHCEKLKPLMHLCSASELSWGVASIAESMGTIRSGFQHMHVCTPPVHASHVLCVCRAMSVERVKQATKDDVEIQKSNVVLVGPTGCGKTLLAKSMARIAGVPVAIVDATSLTQVWQVAPDSIHLASARCTSW